MQAVHLQTEYLTEPLGLGLRQPRLFWQCQGGTVQTAYQIVARRGGETVWDSGKVASPEMTHIRYGGAPLQSRDRIEWSVRLWDETGAPGPWASSWFELGLLTPADWQAQWITGGYKPKKNRRYPVDCFRKTFAVPQKPARARLYVTACGLYEAYINGRRIGDWALLPGNTDLRRRLQYQTFDVTDLLGGDNTLEVWLADGWYRGTIGAFGPRNVFGRQTRLLAQLELTGADGQTAVIATDSTWQWSNDGPIRFADLEDGEVYDANCAPSFAGHAVLANAGRLPAPTASDNVLPKRQEHFAATLLTTPQGRQVLDFGQNLAGFVRFAVQGRKGQTITLTLGETLDKAGEFTQINFQLQRPVKEYSALTEILFMTGMGKLYRGKTQPTPLQKIVFHCSGGLDTYESRFMIAGFRYALVETDTPLTPEQAAQFEAVAVYSDLEQTGSFICSHPKINKLVENIRWSMKSNYCDVPTDCPTRERLAWTGDAQIFFDTGAYLMNTAPFFRKWLRDLQDGQLKNGKLSAVVPYNGTAQCYDATGSSAGWHDAAILVPYRYWKRYGDLDLLRDCYPMMQAAAKFMMDNTGLKDKKAAKANPYNRYTYEKGIHLGEWLEPKEFQEPISAAKRPTHPEECTAYLHLSMSCMAETASALGESSDAALYREYADGAKKAYRWLFLQNGAPDTDRQAKLVRPLAFGLADGTLRTAIEQRLARAVEQRQYRIGTGFLSTCFVLETLEQAGRTDLAYRMLLNTDCPGWLYEVEHSGTTTWESWEGFTGDPGSGSLNHYSPGAVGQWLFEGAAGIRPAGPRAFMLSPAPAPDGAAFAALTSARARYQSLYGTVESGWEKTPDGIRFTALVPANTTATWRLPDGSARKLGPGQHTVTLARQTETKQR